MKKRKQIEGIQCGSCTFLSREKVFEQKCMELGKIPSSRYCKDHQPDAFALVKTQKSNVLKDLATVTKDLTVNELSILATLFLRERYTRKEGYHFYQKVYYRFSGDGSYISNYISARILDANKDRIRLIGMNSSKLVSVTVYAGSNSILSIEEFKVVKHELLQQDRLVDPRNNEKCSPSYRGIIATLDTALEEDALDQDEEIVSNKDDLVTLVSKMGRGLILRKGKKKKSSSIANEDGSIDIKWT